MKSFTLVFLLENFSKKKKFLSVHPSPLLRDPKTAESERHTT